MIDIFNQLLKIQINNGNIETEDIILPDTYFGEFIYIFLCLKDIITEPKYRKQKFSNLIRQIRIHQKWMKIK